MGLPFFVSALGITHSCLDFGPACGAPATVIAALLCNLRRRDIHRNSKQSDESQRSQFQHRSRDGRHERSSHRDRKTSPASSTSITKAQPQATTLPLRDAHAMLLEIQGQARACRWTDSTRIVFDHETK